jgi:hypothetical protein
MLFIRKAKNNKLIAESNLFGLFMDSETFYPFSYASYYRLKRYMTLYCCTLVAYSHFYLRLRKIAWEHLTIKLKLRQHLYDNSVRIFINIFCFKNYIACSFTTLYSENYPLKYYPVFQVPLNCSMIFHCMT